MDKKIFFILALVVLIAAGTRLWDLGHNPFVADEFLDVNATYGYHQTGQWQAWDFNRGAESVRDNNASDERAWLYRAQVSELYHFLPPTETTVRLISALWGILTTLLLYGVAYSFTKNRWIALIAAFLWAVSVPAIEINRKVRMYSMFAPVFLAFSWSLYMFLESKKTAAKNFIVKCVDLNYVYLVPTALLGALAFHLHPLTGNILFVLVGYFLLRAWHVHTTEGWLNQYIAYLGAIVLSAIVAAAFLPEQFAWFTATLVFFENHWHYIGHVLATYWHPLIGAFLVGSGIVFALRDTKHYTAAAWIVANFVVVLMSAIFLWNRNVGPQYIFFVQTFGMMLAAIGLYSILDGIRARFTGKNVFLWGLVIAIVFVPYYGYFFRENNTYHMTASGDSANYRKVFDYVKRHTHEGDVMITRNFRNYYYSGLGAQVFDFGSERSVDALADEGKVKKVTEDYAREIVAAHPSGWVVYSDNDEKFITKEARQYFDDTMMKVDDSSLVRGKVSVYYWQTQT